MKIIINIGIGVLNFIYCFMKLIPMKNKVVMLSRQSNEPSIEFCMIRDELKNRNPDLEVVFLCRTLDGGVRATKWDKFKYAFHMFEQMYHIATSRVVILDTYCMVISLLHHKKNLKIIQMWHSMGTMKKFGYTTLDTAEGSKSGLAYAMRMHQNYDYVFASSEAYKDHLAAGFRCDRDKILTMPLPRLDLLNSKEYAEDMRRRIYKAYPSLKEKPVILYCPTFRKDETDFAKYYQELEDAIDHEKYALVVKLHPLSKVKLGAGVLDAPEFSTFDMFFVADYVISDYSCVIYEAGVLDIPLYFYNFDMDLYTGIRGLAIDYENEIPGVISKDAREIVSAIEGNVYNKEEQRKFISKYISHTDHATADIVDFVYQFLE